MFPTIDSIDRKYTKILIGGLTGIAMMSVSCLILAKDYPNSQNNRAPDLERVPYSVIEPTKRLHIKGLEEDVRMQDITKPLGYSTENLQLIDRLQDNCLHLRLGEEDSD